MREDELRQVLMVKAIEESDRDATIIPAADRATAARAAMRSLPAGDPRLLVARAQALLPRIAARFPFVDEVLALLGPSRAVTLGLVVVGLLMGGALSALDGSRRINILAFPLLGVVAWNLAVYGLLVVLALRPAGGGPGLLRRRVASIGSSLAARLIARSRAFNAPLAGALEAFARERGL